MRSASATAPRRGIFVPPEQVEAYLANGWSVVDDLNPHQVLMLPPTHLAPIGARSNTGARDGP